MIAFEEFTLANGLHVIVHEDPSVQIAVINILYKVGSRDEHPDKTGFAHLFEHLMFGGSINIPDYDTPLEVAGGENNAFTSSDITNYYLSIPAQNVEVGFWLESDRMLGLPFDPEVLEVQRKVVVEEFKQNYFSKPYGDVWLELYPLAYTKHPYQWATIGKKPEHIEQASMDDVRKFFSRYYIPNNAVLVVAGNVKVDQVKELSEKWFGGIPRGEEIKRVWEKEPVQASSRKKEVVAHVPANALYKTYHVSGRFDADYYALELMNDVLSRGHSSRLYNTLVKEKEIFTSLGSYPTGTLDPGLLVISGRVREGISIETAESEVDKLIDEFVLDGVSDNELEKVKNQAESMIEFEEVEVMNRAMSLAFGHLSGSAGIVNQEREKFQSVTKENIAAVAAGAFRKENSSTLYYRSDKK